MTTGHLDEMWQHSAIEKIQLTLILPLQLADISSDPAIYSPSGRLVMPHVWRIKCLSQSWCVGGKMQCSMHKYQIVKVKVLTALYQSQKYRHVFIKVRSIDRSLSRSKV